MPKIILPSGVIGKTVSKPIRLLVGMPIGRPIEVEPHICWARLLAYMVSNPNYIGMDIHETGAYIDYNRDKIAQRAISENAEYLLMIDSDMGYPHTIVDTLISRDKDVIACVYYTPSHDTDTGKEVVIRPMLFDYNRKTKQFHPWPKCDKKEPFRVDAVGTGIILIKTKVFKKIKRPWFFFFERRGEVMGEDLGFCLQCMANKIEVWVDPTIETTHVKTYRYRKEDCTVK